MKKWNQQYHDKFKAFALIHKVWDQKNLEKAWKRVKANKLKKMGLISLSSLLDESVSCKGKSQTKAVYGKTVRTV